MRRVALPLLLYAVPLAVFLWHVRIYDTAADDAYITFRYAHNLARGIGPVWNPGERVEGYSNFLWMVLLALAHAITRADIPTLARGLGILAGAGAIGLAFELTAQMARSLFWATVAALLIATSSAFAAHTPNGLESSMFALCILFVALALLRGSPTTIAAALFAVSTCRFEGALVVALAGLAVVMGGFGSPAARRFFPGALAWAPAYGAWHVWRRLFYGWWTPNSVAAKDGGSPDIRFTQGIAYVKGFFETDKLMTAALLIGAFAIVLRLARRRRAAPAADPAFVFLLLTSFVYTGFVVAIAGCWMPGWRMMAHVVPAIAVFGAVAASWIGVPRIVKAAVALGCAWFGWKQVSVVSAEESLAPATIYWRDEVFGLGEMGAWLERTAPRDVVVATMAAGALPYYATHVRCLDVLGLTNEHIARFGNKDPKSIAGHISTDWPWVLRTRPDVWVSTAGGGFSKTPQPHADRRFAGYATVVFEFTKTTNPQGRYMSLMLRPDRAAQLLQAFRADPDVVVVSTNGIPGSP